MDQILDQVRDAVDAPIDFQGQQVATIVNYAMMSVFGVVAFIVGIVTSSVYNALYVGLAGLVVTMLAVVPPWPFYNRNAVTWLAPRRVGGYLIEPVGSTKKTS